MKSSVFDSFVVFIIAVKILFAIFAGIEIYNKYEGNKDWYEWAAYWKERTEFIFIISMSLICIVLFNPVYKDALVVDRHVRLLFFVYGIIILITSKWHTFFGETPPWFQELQKLV
jgi:hypothetical protein